MDTFLIWFFWMMFPLSIGLHYLKAKIDIKGYERDFERDNPPLPPDEDPLLDRLDTLSDGHPL
jgi:hypothetical protein